MNTWKISDILRLPVYTEAGRFLGHVSDVELDDDMRFARFVVSPKGITGFFEKDLLIHRDQVIALTREKLIVDNGTIKNTDRIPEPDVA